MSLEEPEECNAEGIKEINGQCCVKNEIQL